MSNSTEQPDRYISFCGIDCDANADELIKLLNESMLAHKGSEEWISYFQKKIAEQVKMGRDNLHFIHNQINALYEYFELCNDDIALVLLYQVEQECC